MVRAGDHEEDREQVAEDPSHGRASSIATPPRDGRRPMVEAFLRSRKRRGLIGCARARQRQTPLYEHLPWSVRLFATAPLPPVVSALLFCAAIFLAYQIYCWIVGMSLAEPDRRVPAPAGGDDRLHAGGDRLRPARRRARSGRSRAGAAARGRARRRRARDAFSSLGGRRCARRARPASRSRSDSCWRPEAGPVDGPPLDHPVFLWAAARSVAMGWLIARTVTIELGVAFGFARLGRADVRGRLARSASAGPLRAQGPAQRPAAAALLLPVLALPAGALGQDGGDPDADASSRLLCVAALLLPVSGVRQRLVDAKRAELARVDAALRAEAEANLKQGAARSAGRPALEPGRLSRAGARPPTPGRSISASGSASACT